MILASPSCGWTTVDGRPLAAVLNYACHPVSLGSTCTHITADFPGTARRLLEEQTGATCLFLQGARGNINPLLMGWDWSHLLRLGLPLGAEATRVYCGHHAHAGGCRGRTGRHAFRDGSAASPPRLGGGGAAKPWLPWKRSASASGNPATPALCGGLKAAWSVPARALPSSRVARPCRRWWPSFTAVRVGGSVGLITAPGEIFTEIGQSIVARSPFPPPSMPRIPMARSGMCRPAQRILKGDTR